MPRKKAAPKSAASEKTSIEVVCWVPRGSVRRDEILRSALLVADVPMAAMNVSPEITSASEVKTNEDGEEGRDYLISITWTPRPTRASTVDEEAEVPGTLDKVLEQLEPLTQQRIDDVVDSGTEA